MLNTVDAFSLVGENQSGKTFLRKFPDAPSTVPDGKNRLLRQAYRLRQADCEQSLAGT